MKAPSNRMLVGLIVVILMIAAVVMFYPVEETESWNADLVFVHDSDTPVGSVYVSHTGRDGSGETVGSMNADSSLLERGDDLQFDSVGWPAMVTVCSDLQGREVLAQVVIGEAPAEGWLWRVRLVDSAAGLKLVVTDESKG